MKSTLRILTPLFALAVLPHCGGTATDDRGAGDGDGDDPRTQTGTLIDVTGDGVPDGLDTDGDGEIDIVGVGIDLDNDGIYDGLDTDGDGEIDILVPLSGDGDGDIPGGTGGTTFVPDEFAEPKGIDVLFVIDNSISMADKQQVLQHSVSYFVSGLSEIDAGADVHMGVITSSLGGHGSRLCPRDEADWNNDDQGYLMPFVRSGLTDADGSGFLSWDGTAEGAAIARDAEDHVAAAGETGCGFEAPLEAWYRFLVDPWPPQEIVVDPNTQRAMMVNTPEGDPAIDATLLAQREAFLRPDSVVAIVVLSDENDCSAMDGGAYYNNAGFGYLLAEASFALPIATSVCETNPNDACCFSCLQKHSPPDGCSAAECEEDTKLTPQADRANVRCFQNKRRFGVDLLYPVERYISALTQHHVINARNGATVENPLLVSSAAGATEYRDPANVILTGIVGVPWQDVATDESLTDPSVHEVLPASRLKTNLPGEQFNRWDVMIGDPGLAMSDKECEEPGAAPTCGASPIQPIDPFMIESIAQRTAGLSNPITGDVIVDATSTNPTANAINGHEANHQVIDGNRYPDGGAANDDLQLACIFPLETPKQECTPGDIGCDCGDEPLRNRALCQPPSGGAAGNTQYYAKVYPAPRILQVLKGAGDNAVVGSACPKIAVGDNVSSPNFGYNPVFQRLLEELEARF